MDDMGDGIDMEGRRRMEMEQQHFFLASWRFQKTTQDVRGDINQHYSSTTIFYITELHGSANFKYYQLGYQTTILYHDGRSSHQK